MLALIGAMGWTLASNKKEIDSKKEVKSSTREIAVTVTPVKTKETTGQLQLVGTTEPNREVIVASESAGKITHIHFKMGDFVSKGTVLAQVDDTYKRLALENTQINYKKTKDDYERYQILIKGDAVSETQLRDMKVAYENAAIQLENAKKQVEDTRIVAPFDGYITAQNTELGAYVNVGTSIAEIADIARLKVTLAVSENTAYELFQGQEVSVNASVYRDVDYKGSISRISPKGDNAHKYPVEILIVNDKNHLLKAGTYVNVTVGMGKAKPALMIPRDAIVSSVKDPSVYLVNGETAQLVKINTGRDYQTDLEVLSGLKEGDLVVTNGQINLMDGAKISIIKN